MSTSGTRLARRRGFRRPSVVVVADAFLRYRPSAVYVVPLTPTPRRFPSHVVVESDADNGLDHASWALVEQLRAVVVERCGSPRGNIGPLVGEQLREVVALIMGL